MLVVLDTNVVVSGLLNPGGAPGTILRLVLDNRVTLVLDARILGEYREVLNRPRFPFDQDDVAFVLSYIEQAGEWGNATEVSKNLPDPDDLPFLEVAIGSKVDALITGNARHFPETSRTSATVLTPSGFLQIFHQTMD